MGLDHMEWWMDDGMLLLDKIGNDQINNTCILFLLSVNGELMESKKKKKRKAERGDMNKSLQ